MPDINQLPTDASSHYETIQRVLEYVDSIYPDEADVQELAQVSGLSDYYFSRLFSAYVGIPPKKYLQFLRRDYAIKVLETAPNLLEAAHQMKLSGTGRLHDLFVTTEAVTPGQWKHRGQGLTIGYSIHSGPFGGMFVAETPKGICELHFFEGDPTPLVRSLRERWPRAEINVQPNPTFNAAALFKQGWPFRIHLMGTNFQLKVWQALLKIPEGQLVSYGAVAEAAGNHRAVRATASAIGQNPIAILIPCHRVIRKCGAFSEYRWGPARKRMLIAYEAARQSSAGTNASVQH